MSKKLPNRLVILILILITIAPTCGSAATIVQFGFVSDFTASEIAPDIAATSFNSGPAISSVNLDNDGQPPQSWSGTNWVTSDNPSDALSSDSYAWFRVTPQAGMAMTLTSIAFDVRPDGSGPDSFIVSIIDVTSGLSSQMGGVLMHSDQTKFDGGRKTWETLFASSDSLLSLIGTQEIRIYGFDAAQSNRDVLLDNVSLFGTVFSVPEPSLPSLLSLSGVFLVCRRRR